jgi:hypothetical protein
VLGPPERLGGIDGERDCMLLRRGGRLDSTEAHRGVEGTKATATLISIQASRLDGDRVVAEPKAQTSYRQDSCLHIRHTAMRSSIGCRGVMLEGNAPQAPVESYR